MAEALEDKHDMEYILRLLGEKGSLTTDEIVDALKEWKAENYSADCNDRTMRNLISMKKNGKVLGKMNRQKRTWEWTQP